MFLSELRKRNKDSNSSETEDQPADTKKVSSGYQAEKYVHGIASNVPSNVRPYLEHVAPIVGKAVEIIEASLPYFYAAYQKYLEVSKIIEPYRLDLLAPALFGIILCFFGGSYLTLIAAVEAYRISAWAPTSIAIKSLYRDFQLCQEADAKDNVVDEDKNGVPDVTEISSQDLLKRKLFLFAKTVDPSAVTVAITAVNTGALAVIATLKMRFASAITLGSSIGEVVERPALKYFDTPLQQLLPSEF
eukprot:gene13839-29436_t